MTAENHKKTKNGDKVRLSRPAYDHAKEIVRALNKKGYSVTLKSFVSSIILMVDDVDAEKAITGTLKHELLKKE